jgi:hypothetical protein
MAKEETKHQQKYEVRLYKIDGGGGKEEMIESREVPMEKIQEQQATELPNREAMSLVNANIAAPINLALALNVLSDNSVAIANAQQWAPINQST